MLPSVPFPSGLALIAVRSSRSVYSEPLDWGGTSLSDLSVVSCKSVVFVNTLLRRALEPVSLVPSPLIEACLPTGRADL